MKNKLSVTDKTPNAPNSNIKIVFEVKLASTGRCALGLFKNTTTPKTDK